jgi:hypothetical protein
MGKKKVAVTPLEQEYGLEDTAVFDQENAERVVVLQKEPLQRKAMLIHAGVKDVRCLWCLRIKPLATAEELGDGWICETCLSDVERQPGKHLRLL